MNETGVVNRLLSILREHEGRDHKLTVTLQSGERIDGRVVKVDNGVAEMSIGDDGSQRKFVFGGGSISSIVI